MRSGVVLVLIVLVAAPAITAASSPCRTAPTDTALGERLPDPHDGCREARARLALRLLAAKAEAPMSRPDPSPVCRGLSCQPAPLPVHPSLPTAQHLPAATAIPPTLPGPPNRRARLYSTLLRPLEAPGRRLERPPRPA